MIRKNERLRALEEDEVIVAARGVIGRLSREFAGHAEVDAEPRVAAEAEEHLFRGGFRGDEFRAGEVLLDEFWISAAKDAGACMKADVLDALAEAGVPAFAEEFYFGELGHRQILNREWTLRVRMSNRRIRKGTQSADTEGTEIRQGIGTELREAAEAEEILHAGCSPAVSVSELRVLCDTCLENYLSVAVKAAKSG